MYVSMYCILLMLYVHPQDGFNALHLSANGGHVGVAQYLAPVMGVHLFDLTDTKNTALHIAVGNGHLPMVEHLVKSAGFNVKDKNKVCMQTQSFNDLFCIFLAWVFVFCEMPYGAIYVLQSYFVR